MQLNLNKYAEKLLPSFAYKKASPFITKVEGAFSGTGDKNVSRRTAIFAFSIRIASAAIAYFSQVLLARFMGEFEYGIYVAVWIWAVILGGLVCLGFQTGIIRFISEYRSDKRESLLRGSIFSAITISMVSATIIAMIGAAIVYFYGDHLFESYYYIPLLLATTCLPLLALSEVHDGIARAFDMPRIALAPIFILRPLLILGIMLIAILAGYEVDAKSAIIATIIAVYITALYQFIVLKMKLKPELGTTSRSYTPKAWFKVTLPIFLVEGFYNLLTNVDILILASYESPEKVGIYFAAAKTLALVHFVYFAVKAAAAHRFASYLSSGNKQEYENFINETIHWTFWPSLFLALVMLVLGKYFLMLFGESFAVGISVIWILTLGIIVRSSVGAAESVLTMSGKQNLCALVYAVSLCVAITLCIILIPIYGLNGAALATTLTLCCEALGLYLAARYSLDLHVFIIPKRKKKLVS
ncbi:MAG: lipopolysaccharide biosynthesis protein [Nitratireductor sp.]